MDGKDGERQIKSCRTHVELHIRSVDKRKSTQPGKGGAPQETNHVHYAMHKLGLCWNFRRSRVGARKHNCPACGRNDGHGNEQRNWYSVCVAMVHVVVFKTNIVEWNIGNTRDESRHHEAVNMAIMDAISRPFG